MVSTVLRQCAWCSKDFQALEKEVKRGKGQMCSVSCANAKRASDRKDPEARKKWIAANRHTEHFKLQRKAHHAVQQEVRMGRMRRQPCEVCGCNKQIHAHHDDYTKPLEVRWLCVAHHRQHHG